MISWEGPIPRSAADDLAAKNEASAQARDIGPPPAPVNDVRRQAGIDSLLSFLRSYFPDAFPLPFCNDHLEVIATIERVVTDGGQYALAMPRGSGKTTLCIRAALWAILTGRRRFVLLLGATEKAATKLLKSIKEELWTNQTLCDDFAPEIWGIPQLQGDARKAGGQLCMGEKTAITWKATELAMPRLAGSMISGHCITTSGLTGSFRGLQQLLPDGTIIRPDLVLLDDPQTRESARSATQSEERVAIIEGDVLGLAGPKSAIAALMPCTVIEAGDMADDMLQQEKHPLWQGKRTKMLYKRPENERLWDEYFQLRAECLRVDKSPARSNDFFREHQAELEYGADVAWAERFNADEVSAVQSAMHLWYRNPAAFAAEYQNDPVPADGGDASKPSAASLSNKLLRTERRIVPRSCHRVTAFIDVQGQALFYVVAAFSEDFGGTIIDYGTEPEQPRGYFTLQDLRLTLESEMIKDGVTGALEARLWYGLNKLVNRLCGSAWLREDGTELRVQKCLIDSGWGESTDTIYEFCRRSPHAAVLLPSKGVGLKAGDRPMTEWPKRESEIPGFHHVQTRDPKKRSVSLVKYDTNFWKTFLCQRIGSAPGTRSGLTIFGDKPEQHRMIADHFTAESCTKTEGRGRVVWEWRCPPGVDNHYWDCGVGCLVAASLLGCSLTEVRPMVDAPKAKVKFSDLQRLRR